MPTLLLIFFSLSLTALGADPPIPVAPPQTPQIVQPDDHSNIAKDFLADQQSLWASPLKIKRGDVKWLLPLGVGVAALLAADKNVVDEAREAEGLRSPSRILSNFGGGASMAVASGSFYGIGKLTHNEKAADTGRLAGEAVLHTQLVVQALKVAFNRERPNKVNGNGGFWDGGKSFPSGHAATTFAFATVVADRYKDKKIVAIGVYGLAAAVSMSRIGGMNHQPSDVMIGAAIGHLIGRYIIHRHPAE